jgi:biotin transport system substrate-specific component
MTLRGVVFSALFAALLCVFSFVRIDIGTPVPIALENMAVMMAGAFLGAWYGFFSMLLVVVLTAIGLPLLAGGGGLSVVLGYTGGFIVTWPICALLTGWFVTRVKGNGWRQYLLIGIVVEVFGSLFNYVGGVPWLAVTAHMSIAKAMVAGCYPFLLGDLLKAIVTTAIVIPIRNVYPVARLVGRGGTPVATLESSSQVSS